MPHRSSFKSKKAYLDWYKEYRAKNRVKIREYNNRFYATHYKKYEDEDEDISLDKLADKIFK